MKYKFEEMIPSEFLTAVENCPVFIIPTGLLEWHGDHLPLGQDTMKIYGICLEIAKKLNGGIVLPPNYIGRPGFSRYVGTLTYSEALVNLLFTEMFEQLVKVGAKVILLLTGHYGSCQVDCVKLIAKNFQAEHPEIKIIASAEYENVLVNGETPSDHAGKWETSMFWHLYPELTYMENFKHEVSHIHCYDNVPNDNYKAQPDWEWNENLSETTSRELGAKAIDIISSHFAGLIKSVLE